MTTLKPSDFSFSFSSPTVILSTSKSRDFSAPPPPVEESARQMERQQQCDGKLSLETVTRMTSHMDSQQCLELLHTVIHSTV